MTAKGGPRGCPDVPELHVESRRASSVGGGHARQAFGEDLAFTGEIVTEEVADMEPESHRQLLPREIDEVTKVVRMNAGGFFVTQRAFSYPTDRLNTEGNRRGFSGE